MNSRIELSDTLLDTVMKMCGGNPGAVSVLTNLMKGGGIGAIMLLDSFGIYESRIWMLYKDVCDQDVVKTIALIRARQLGIITQNKLDTAIDNRGEGLNLEEVLAKVKKQLVEFGKNLQTA